MSRVVEVVPQDGDPSKVLLLFSDNRGSLVDSSMVVKSGDLVIQSMDGLGRPVTHTEVLNVG